MSNPKVSVLIPNYNHARYLPRRIESVLNQSCQDFEVIIMDDYSPDNSREVIEKYAALDARITVVYNKQNSGSTFKQWNKGFALAKGKYVWIAESDDYAHPRFLETLVSILDTDNQIGLAYSASYTVDEHDTIIDKGETYFSELDPTLWNGDFIMDGLPLIRRFMIKSNIIPNASAVLIRRSVIEDIGPADDSKRLVGDWLYWARILACNRVAYSAEPLNYFRKHTNNVRSGSAVSGVALLEFVEVTKQMKFYGEINEIAYNERLSFICYNWFNSIIYGKVPMRTHRAIYKALVELDPSTRNLLMKFFVAKRFSGFRMLLGDKFLFPIISKLKD